MKNIIFTLVAAVLVIGCDFGTQPTNEILYLTLEAYKEVTKDYDVTDLQRCVSTYTVGYTDEVKCGDNELKEGASFGGCALRDIITRKIIISNDPRYNEISDVFLSHEYIHAIEACLDIEDHGAGHVDPLFWTCKGSVEWVVAAKLGHIPQNSTYKTECAVEAIPPDYNPGK